MTIGNAQVDLHLHTTASDGRRTPQELVQLLVKRGVRYAAITDHDTTEGLDAAFEEAAKHPGLTLIPGIELSCDIPGSEVHMLGLFMDYRNPELQTTLRRFRDGRAHRGQQMVEKLTALGYLLEWADVQRIANGAAIGRPHVALALMERGYVSSTQEAFDRFLGRNGPAYAEREKMTPVEAIHMISAYKGLAVFAHPTFTENADALISEMCQAGLVGMEVFYKSYPPDVVGYLFRLARKHNLVPCGGTDFHGLSTHGEVEPGTAGPPIEVFTQLERLANAKRSVTTA
ncbi:MAG: PHP domain-containing protein [Dehalococcoidia bacterium]|nr:PHP domain-containing protein [Dehalococcoidia bacterium]